MADLIIITVVSAVLAGEVASYAVALWQDGGQMMVGGGGSRAS